jgi:hypothetical protein
LDVRFARPSTNLALAGKNQCFLSFRLAQTQFRYFVHHSNKKATARVAFLFEWWKRRESNPRPQILNSKVYMHSRIIYLTVVTPTGRLNIGEFA